MGTVDCIFIYTSNHFTDNIKIKYIYTLAGRYNSIYSDVVCPISKPYKNSVVPNTFIPWHDATIAFIAMLPIYGKNNITRDSVEKSMFKVKGVMNSIKERRHVKDAGQ